MIPAQTSSDKRRRPGRGAAPAGWQATLAALRGSRLRLPRKVRGLFTALLCSVTSLALLEVRIVLSGRATFQFLAWNLLLAWIPYVLALAASGAVACGLRRRWVLGPLAAGWLLFLPNAPYLVTDFVHLFPRPGVPLWADIGLLAIFAGTGWLLGLLSLHAWKAIIETRFGRLAGWGFASTATLLCGFGIYLGRFLRWNSWDVLAAPREIALGIAGLARDPSLLPRMAGVTLLFAALMFVSYLAFELLGGPGPRDERAGPR
jgi:uncharacterized membrane protein